jgi:tRNA/rRNA methyltransferase
MSLANVRVVLVRPQVAGNLGATARVMRNMGLTDLVLVAPEADPGDREACKRSTHGEAILRSARIVTSFEDAVADCGLVVGTSARIGGPFRRQSVGTVREVIPRLVGALPATKAALVFGPEPTGLSNADVTRCHYVMHIPADETYPALNLGQSVAICLYELRVAWLALESRPQPAHAGEPAEAGTPAPFADQERMFAHLRTALEEIHFLYGTNADSLMHAIRHLIGRAQPTAMEVDLLFGLARQLRWHAAHHPQRPET